ncbi:MAG: glycosyltransferase [Clostridiales bacterium]|nr:glycosyltransferase [Clostridiales bacterium]
MDNQLVNTEFLIETSWEVCNKIGGIYTVLSTKAKSLHDIYKDKLVFIGPDVWTSQSPSPYFKESKTLLKEWRNNTGLPQGVNVRVGRWDIPGKPIVILVSFQSLYSVKDQLYGEMWNRYGVDSLHAYGDYDEACSFSHAAALVIESLSQFHRLDNGRGIIAHFNEWTTGMGLLHVKWKLPCAATVFTTHATSIGRSICGNGKPLYDYLPAYNGDQMAMELNMQSKHSLEKAAAQQADCFTTVSDVTAAECAQLLEKAPDVVTPNGFEARFVPSAGKMPAARKAARKRLLEIANTLTGQQLDDTTAIVATSGRCEYRNKGIDLFIDAVNQLRATDYRRKVLALILVPAWSRDARRDLQQAIAQGQSGLKLGDSVITHNLNNPDSDAILNRIHQLKFNDIPDDNVTLVYIPCYLNGDDGIVNMTYYDVLPAMDATVFPSYYEPWGYTPLESVAFGVPTVTTSLSGFGQWVLTDVGRSLKTTGVEVVERNDSNYDYVCDKISDTLRLIINGTKEQDKELSVHARHTASLADWAHFIGLYEQAFAIAVANSARRNN